MIKSVLHRNEKHENKYPYIGIADNDLVVLFSCKETGVCLDPGKSCHEIGYHCTLWLESEFNSIEGSITLSNV